MIDPYNFEDDDFELEEEDFFLMKSISEMTEGERLQRFKHYFDSSCRAMLQDCLFRIIDHEDGTGTLEILCPNEAVQQRLGKKKRKIINSMDSCWLHLKWFSLCVQHDGELVCHTYARNGELVNP